MKFPKGSRLAERLLLVLALALAPVPAAALTFVDAHVFQENPVTTPTPVPRLLLVDAPGSTLTSDYLFISSSVTGSAPTWYISTPDQLRFLQANTYHHAYRFIQNKLVPNGYDYIQSHISFVVTVEPAGLVHSGNTVAAVGGDNARDADIIVHETFHAFLNTQIQNPPTSEYAVNHTEYLAFHEGMADYSAAIMNGNTWIGETGGGYDIRTNPTTFHYSRYNELGDSYGRGRILNGALIDLRDVIGPVVDDLVYQTIILQSWPMGFRAFLDAMIQTDYEGWDGAHVAAIRSAFATRGITPSPPENLVVLGPTAQFASEPANFSASVTSGIGPLEYIWWAKQDGEYTQWIDTGWRTTSIHWTSSIPYSLKLQVVDREGTSFYSPPFHVDVVTHEAYQPPSGLVISGPTTLMQGEEGTYSASLTGGQGAGGVTFSWTTSVSSQPYYGTSFTTTLGLPGNAEVRATAVDGFGNSTTTVLPVTVTAGPLLVELGGPSDLLPGEVGEFQASVSGGVPPYTYDWRQSGSGINADLGTGSTAISLPAPDDFQIRVIVLDATGTGQLATKIVRVGNPSSQVSLRGEGDPMGHEAAFRLGANFPNPVHDATEISFSTAVEGPASLELFDSSGRRVATLIRGSLQPGPHRVAWNGRDDSGAPVAAGVYWYRLKSGDLSQTRRLLLLK